MKEIICKMKKDTLKLTYVGMIGAILTIIGDFLLLGVDSNTSGGGLFDKYLDIASKISYTRIGLAGFFGYLGIPLTAIGFLALHRMIKEKESPLAKVYKWSMSLCFAALGGGRCNEPEKSGSHDVQAYHGKKQKNDLQYVRKAFLEGFQENKRQ
jgi:hypothetical protein